MYNYNIGCLNEKICFWQEMPILRLNIENVFTLHVE